MPLAQIVIIPHPKRGDSVLLVRPDGSEVLATVFRPTPWGQLILELPDGNRVRDVMPVGTRCRRQGWKWIEPPSR